MKRVKTLALCMVIALIILRSAATQSSTERTHEKRSSGAEQGVYNESQEQKPFLKLDPKQIEQAGLQIAVAGRGRLSTNLTWPGKITMNTDRIAHVVPRVAGVVREVTKTLGDTVAAQDVLAVIDSHDLSERKAAYLAAIERLALADAKFAREHTLWRKKISAELDYLQAKGQLAEARIAQRAAEHELHALGFDPNQLRRLAQDPSESLSRYGIIAPIAGTIVDKRISLGEALEANASAFVIADLSTVWVDLSVAPKDLALVAPGSRVVVSSEDGPPALAKISYVQPLVNEETRTVLVRGVLANTDRRWRPGLFVTAEISAGATEVPLLIPRSAVQILDGQSIVFVETTRGFEPHAVRIGRSNDRQVEIFAGLRAGERYVAEGGFILKSELSKGETADGD